MGRSQRSKRLKVNNRAKGEKVRKREDKLLGQLVERMKAESDGQNGLSTMEVMTPVQQAPVNTITPPPARRVVVTITEAKMDVEEPGRPNKSVGGIKKKKKKGSK